MSEDVEDRISNLPASLLHHILSFVDTRDAAQTSVLSKRWEYIWRSIPALRFQCLKSSQVGKFMDFVDKTLEFHDESNIQKFSLQSDVLSSEPRIEKWITTIVRHNVEALSLSLHQRDPIFLPSSLYSCDSLTTLILYITPSINFPKCISFPRLEVLMLFGVEFGGEGYNEQLFSDCPVLESLSLAGCSWPDMKNFCISNPALKKMMVVNLREEEVGLQNCILKIHAPNLMLLSYIGRVAKDYVLSSFPRLVEANIDFYLEDYAAMSEQERYDYGAAVSKFLQALAHVANLRISNQTLQVLSIADGLLNNLPPFSNLLKLSLTQKLTADKALIALLETAPNLVSLSFKGFASPFLDEEEDDNDDSGDDGSEEDNSDDDGSEDEDEDDDSGDDGSEDNHYDEADAADGDEHIDNEDDGWMLDMVAARCSFLHIKLVKLEEFTGNAREMRWVKLILRNARFLLTMTIDPISSMKSENLMADISNLPRASASCVFKVTKQG